MALSQAVEIIILSEGRRDRRDKLLRRDEVAIWSLLNADMIFICRGSALCLPLLG
ncbi:hypothetical protein AB3R30_22605 [Leptolyngbyaceae cyanobacterium UHCC 1019]